MKVSRYNKLIDLSSDTILYNTFSGCVIKLHGCSLAESRFLIEKDTLVNNKELPSWLYNKLKRGGLIENDIDEYNRVIKLAKMDNNILQRSNYRAPILKDQDSAFLRGWLKAIKSVSIPSNKPYPKFLPFKL